MMKQMGEKGFWWGPFEFRPSESRIWELGPLSLWVCRFNGEYRISWRRDPQGDETALKVGQLTEPPDYSDLDTVRFGARESDRKLMVQPATADRPAVVKAEKPFIVPPKGQVTAFVSSPAWFQVELTDPLRPLYEEPSLRPSDTWFGPSTTEGELCYAIRTSVRFNLENVPVWPYRVVSVVRIANQAETPLPLARLRIPLPLLSLYAGEDGRLWTEAVTLDRDQNDDRAQIKLGDSAPREAGPCVKVAKPRQIMDRLNPIHSFTGLLGLRKGKEGYERIVE